MKIKWSSFIVGFILSFFCASFSYSVEKTSDHLDQAYNFLYKQMDMYHKSVLVSGNKAYQAFYPSGMMGDVSKIAVSQQEMTFDGEKQNCLILKYSQANGALPYNFDTIIPKWSGVYFQYPDKNWGEYSGRDMSGATRLSFYAKSDPPMRVKFIAGGINTSHLYSKGNNSDSFSLTTQAMTPLTKQWKQYAIDLKSEDLSSVIGAFGVILDSLNGSREGSIWVRDVQIDLPLLNKPRFAQSFVANECVTGAPENVAHVYDQSLALLALLVRGTQEDIKRAELIAQALVVAQNNDRYFDDGRLRNAYSGAVLVDEQTGKATLPGKWDEKANKGAGKFLEDEFAVGSDTGNMTWAGLALAQAHVLLPKKPGDPYLQAALRIGKWIVRNNKVEGKIGGFRGGFEYFEESATNPQGQFKSEWRSTEHNIDLTAFFGHLASIAGANTSQGNEWLKQQTHARNFVQHMIVRDGDLFFLRTGTKPGSDELNDEAIPLDTQTWSVLGLGNPSEFQPALNWALKHCNAGKAFPLAFDFNCNDGDGAWWEGTSQVATALKITYRIEEAEEIIQEIEKNQITKGPGTGAFPAASKCGLTTGLGHFWHANQKIKPWTYPNSPHIGATCWYIFAKIGKNPYYLVNK